MFGCLGFSGCGLGGSSHASGLLFLFEGRKFSAHLTSHLFEGLKGARGDANFCPANTNRLQIQVLAVPGSDIGVAS